MKKEEFKIIGEDALGNKIFNKCPRCGKKDECCYLCHDCMQELSDSSKKFPLKKIFYENGCTIIIPTFNCEDTLNKCLMSIPEAFPDKVKLEIIFVDKESTDRTFDCIEVTMMIGKLDQIPYRVVIETGKLGKARLHGIEHAKYKTLFWLDSDIVLPKNYIVNLFYNAENLLDQGKIPTLADIFGLQGWMNCGSDEYPRQELWHKWWHGYDIIHFRKEGFCGGSPTADLLNLNDYQLTFKEKQELSQLSSQEDNYLSAKVQSMGYKMYAVDISVPHLKFSAKNRVNDHEILWLLVGEKDQGKTKLQALWHFKWTLMRGFESFQVYADLRLLTLTFKIWMNALRVMLKDERIISGERLTSLRDW